MDIDSTNPHSQPPKLCLLSLDGGGIRGISSIILLKKIMRKINYGRERKLHPWQVFDLMGGTGTGGLIAIMLGRLRMSLEECQTAYLEISKKSFAQDRYRRNIISQTRHKYHARARFNSEALTDAILALVRDRNAEDELLKDDRDGCKVFITTVLKSATRLKLLRSYSHRDCDMLDVNDTCKIWEACRATTAAKFFFDDIEIGELDVKFTDAGMMKNNPISLVLQEGRILYGEERVKDAIILSIGTGGPTSPPVEGNLFNIINAMKIIITQTREAHQEFCRSHPDIMRRNLFFRFDVDDQQLNNVQFYEVERVNVIAAATEGYVGDYEVKERLERCRVSRSEYLESVPPRIHDLTNERCADNISHKQTKEEECLEKDTSIVDWRHPQTTTKDIRLMFLDTRSKYTQTVRKIKSANSLYRAHKPPTDCYNAMEKPTSFFRWDSRGVSEATKPAIKICRRREANK